MSESGGVATVNELANFFAVPEAGVRRFAREKGVRRCGSVFVFDIEHARALELEVNAWNRRASGKSDPNQSREFTALKTRYELLCDRSLVLQQQDEESRGYRQHAEQEALRLRKILIDVAPFALKELKQLSHDQPSVDRYDELIATLKEFHDDEH